MNLKDLHNIDIKDLKNIDWDRIKDRLQSRPDLIINIFLIIVTLVVIFSTYNKHVNTEKQSGKKTLELQKKLKALEKFKITQKQHDDFLQNIPKAISGNQLIETLSEFAIKRDVQILSFSPAKEKSNKLINLTSVEVNIASKNYVNIVLFMRDIENSPYPMRIETWSGTSVMRGGPSKRSPRRSTQRTADETIEKEYIEATIKIGSVEFKNV